MGLLEAMSVCHSNRVPIGVILIDARKGAYEAAEAQMTVLQHAHKLGIPIVLVGNGGRVRPDHHALANQVVSKTSFNAFDPSVQPPLRSTLKGLGLAPWFSRLVIMGEKTNQCVKLTAVGGQDRELSKGGGPIKLGATGYGYYVMTCPQVLEGSFKATWSESNRVDYYLHL